MYAVIDFGGKQYKVEKGDEVVVDRVATDEGKTMTVTPVLLGGSKKAATAAELKGARVKAKVEEHFLGDKIIVFKYKPKQGYRRKKGHRSRLSRLSIQTITSGKKTSEPKAEAKASEVITEKKAPAKAKAAKKASPKSESKPVKKPAAKTGKQKKKTEKSDGS